MYLCLLSNNALTKSYRMKKEQFNHNIAKAKRIADAQRQNKGVNDVLNDMFSSWNELYSDYNQLKEKLNK